MSGELYGMSMPRRGPTDAANHIRIELAECQESVRQLEDQLAAAQSELAELSEWTSSDERAKMKAELQRYHEELDRSMMETEEANAKLAAAREALSEIGELAEHEYPTDHARDCGMNIIAGFVDGTLRRIAELAKGGSGG